MIQKLKASFIAVFSGDATGRQFIEVFVVIASVALMVLLLMMLRN